MTKQEASSGLGVKCQNCGSVFPNVDWYSSLGMPGNTGCGKNGCHTGTVEPNWVDGVVPIFDEPLITPKGLEAKSICPNCNTLWHYPPNSKYYCEVCPSSFVELVDLDLHIDPKSPKKLTLISFSYKYGLPPNCDKIYDVRNTVRNPWRDSELRKLDGLHPSVQKFVFNCKGAKKILVSCSLWGNKPDFTVAVGCMGGKHRSVAIVEGLKNKYISAGWDVDIQHRDLYRPRAKKGPIDGTDQHTEEG